MKAIDPNLQTQYFPMKLPAGVEGRLVDEQTAHLATREIGPTIFTSREALGLFTIPRERREGANRLEALHQRSEPLWVVMYDEQDAPVGWFYGYMEDESCFFMDTVALVQRVRRCGIYTAFLQQMLPYLRAQGYERFATSHLPNNRGIMIAELKVGFNFVGMEFHESHGILVKMAYFLHDDRRHSFQEVFHMEPEMEA